jgi:RNA polymerase sigma-70 factor (ECF subfamily)
MVEQGDQALVDAVRVGSTTAFEEIMKHYQHLVYVTCFTYAGSREDALDLTQDVFVKVYRKMGSFRGTGTFKAWLLRIAHNEALNWVRSNARYQGHDELTPANTPKCEPRQGSDLAGRERWTLLQKALLHLNPKQRQAVMLRYFDGASASEIASILGCSEGTAKNMLFRSLQKLRHHLLPYWREL